MTISVYADPSGTYGTLSLNGSEKFRLNSDGTMMLGGLPAFQCRAWALFNGQTSGTSAPLGAGNVSSIQRLSTGVYRIFFVTPMPNTNYCVQASTSGAPGYNMGTTQVDARTLTHTDVVSIGTTGQTQTNANASFMHISVFA